MALEELHQEDAFLDQPIIAVQQIQSDVFVVSSTKAVFYIYDRNQKKITKELKNPTGSINMNCLQKVVNFSEDYPYIIFKDSRFIGVINCYSMTVQTLSEAKYRRGGNLYSMNQFEDE
jgi:hypothetical protein